MFYVTICLTRVRSTKRRGIKVVACFSLLLVSITIYNNIIIRNNESNRKKITKLNFPERSTMVRSH
jgi:hypothetical protein